MADRRCWASSLSPASSRRGCIYAGLEDVGSILRIAQSRIPQERGYTGVAFYGRPTFFLAGFCFRSGVSGSPIAASTTERASRLGSVGFFFGFFLAVGFGMVTNGERLAEPVSQLHIAAHRALV